MAKNEVIKGKTSDEAFQEQRFLWERGASVGADIDLLKERRKKKLEKAEEASGLAQIRT